MRLPSKALLAIWLPAGTLVVWQILASRQVINVLFFPAPTVILAAGWSMAKSGELGAQVGATLVRMSLGSALGIISGLACGLAMGSFGSIRRSLEPILSALNATPKLALLPMLMLIAGIGETARIVPIALSTFIVLAIHGLDAVRDMNPAYVELARNYGADRRAMLRHVYLPASLPRIFTGLRLALGRALVLTISVELVSSTDGLGSMIWMAWQTFSTEKLYLGVFMTSILGLLFHHGLLRLEASLIPWGNRSAGRRQSRLQPDPHPLGTAEPVYRHAE
jgi:ABC-type nitrate/sulfonate/bicarbonate transport system permease component